MSERTRILIVDDEPDIVEFLSFNFEREGYEVKGAGNGVEAIEVAMEFSPRLIIMDLMMPEMDGIEACQLIRQNAESYDPIIVLLTARGEDYSQIAGFDAGADDYVVKPISPKVMIARMKALMKLKEGKRSSSFGKSDQKIALPLTGSTIPYSKTSRKFSCPGKSLKFSLLWLKNQTGCSAGKKFSITSGEPIPSWASAPWMFISEKSEAKSGTTTSEP